MKILQVCFDYLPSSIGGTEVYVAGLSRALRQLGHDVMVLIACSRTQRSYYYEETPVDFIPWEGRRGVHEEGSSTDNYQNYIAAFGPDIIHFHPLYLTPLLPVMRAARRLSIPSVCTYHTPTITCGRGNMTRWDKYNCDGEMEWAKCTACVLQQKGIPEPAAIWLPALLTRGGPFTEKLGQFPFPRKMRSMFKIPLQRKKHIDEWKEAVSLIDCWVGVAKWVMEIIKTNGIQEDKIVLCRQGLCHKVPSMSEMGAPESALSEEAIKHPGRDKPLHLGYLGRIQPQKGIDILLKTMKMLRGRTDIMLSVAGIDRLNLNTYENRLIKSTENDARIRWLEKLQPDEVPCFLRTLDYFVVPSLWLETGPMTVLEAWAQGVPVIGSNLAGITEWVEEYGGGLLFRPGDAEDLKNTVLRLLQGKGRDIGIRVPERIRTIADVAEEMTALYQGLIAKKTCHSVSC